MLRRQERDFLDDTTLAEAQEALGVPVVPVESDGFQLWDAVCGLPPESSAPVPPEQTENTEYYRYNPSR